MLRPGSSAPTFSLPSTNGSGDVADPWREGPVLLAFFKVTCPTCKLAAPKVAALAAAGGRVVAIGQDPLPALTTFATEFGQLVPTASDAPPYAVSDAYEIHHVPTLLLVGSHGVVVDAVAGWDRVGWNRLAEAAGLGPISVDDGLPSFRPG